MKVAIVGSRNLHVENLEKNLPKNTTEIVSGGARGIDFRCASICPNESYSIERISA